MESADFSFSICKVRDYDAVAVCFSVSKGQILHITKEYNLGYVPETNEWFGDVIAYGQWWDLEQDEVAQLREAYSLDALMQDYLEHGGEQQVTNDRYAAAK